MATIQQKSRVAASGASRCSGRLSIPKLAQASRAVPRSRTHGVVTVAAMGGPDADEGQRGPLSREAEPEEYWSSPSEKKGANPFKDPVAIIGIFAILFPFLFVVAAIGTGAIDTSVYR